MNKWLTNLWTSELKIFLKETVIPREELVIAEPEATSFYTSEQLSSMGVVGIYRKEKVTA